MPNGHLTARGGRAAITNLFGSACIFYVLPYLKSVRSFLVYIEWGAWGVCALTWALAGGGRRGGGQSNHEIRYLLQRASVGAYLKAGLI